MFSMRAMFVKIIVVSYNDLAGDNNDWIVSFPMYPHAQFDNDCCE